MKRKGKGNGLGIGFFLLMPVLTILLAFLFAKLILSGVISEDGIGWCACVVTGIVSLVFSMTSSFRCAQKKFLWGMAVALIYGILLMLGNFLFFGVGYGTNIPAVLGTVILCGILGSLLGSRKHRKYA